MERDTGRRYSRRKESGKGMEQGTVGTGEGILKVAGSGRNRNKLLGGGSQPRTCGIQD